MIPNHVIDKFIDTYKEYPSIIEVSPDYIKSDLNILFKKSRLIWFSEEINYLGERIVSSRAFEYDSSGIFTYINSENKLFILTTVNRKGFVDFMVNNLKNK